MLITFYIESINYLSFSLNFSISNLSETFTFTISSASIFIDSNKNIAHSFWARFHSKKFKESNKRRVSLEKSMVNEQIKRVGRTDESHDFTLGGQVASFGIWRLEKYSSIVQFLTYRHVCMCECVRVPPFTFIFSLLFNTAYIYT